MSQLKWRVASSFVLQLANAPAERLMNLSLFFSSVVESVALSVTHRAIKHHFAPSFNINF